MLPKLHKNEELSRIISNNSNDSEYLKIKLETKIDGRPISSGPTYHTKGISIILHEILKPALEKVEHILRDTSDFVERVDKKNPPNTKLVSWDIKSLYTNIGHELFYDRCCYDQLHEELPLLQIFSLFLKD